MPINAFWKEPSDTTIFMLAIVLSNATAAVVCVFENQPLNLHVTRDKIVVFICCSSVLIGTRALPCPRCLVLRRPI